MSIAFQCDQCGKHYAAGDHLAGKALKCKGVWHIGAHPRRGVRQKSGSGPPRPTPPPDQDVYGMAEQPTPGTSSHADPIEAGGEFVPVLLGAGAYEPPSKGKPKRLAKRAAKMEARKESNAGGAMKLAFGAVFFIDDAAGPGRPEVQQGGRSGPESGRRCGDRQACLVG